MPHPPESPWSGEWRMGARLFISRIFRRCRSPSLAVSVVCIWLCLITVINLASSGPQSDRKLKEDAHLFVRSSDQTRFSALLGLSPNNERTRVPAGVIPGAKLILRNDLNTSFMTLKSVKKTGEEGQTSSMIKNGFIGRRRIQEIKISHSVGSEILSRTNRRSRSKTNNNNNNNNNNNSNNSFTTSELTHTEGKLYDEIKLDHQKLTNSLNDLQRNWAFKDATYIFSAFRPGNLGHERTQSRKKSEQDSAVSRVGNIHFKHSIISSPSSSLQSKLYNERYRKQTSRESVTTDPTVKYGLLDYEKSIRHNMPRNISDTHNSRSTFYNSINEINTHFNGEERQTAHEKEMRINYSRTLSPGESYQISSVSVVGWNRATHTTQPPLKTRVDLNLRNSLVQTDAFKRSKEPLLQNAVEQNKRSSSYKTTQYINQSANFSEFSLNINQSDNFPEFSLHINQSDNFPELSLRINQSDNFPELSLHINRSDNFSEFNLQENQDKMHLQEDLVLNQKLAEGNVFQSENGDEWKYKSLKNVFFMNINSAEKTKFVNATLVQSQQNRVENISSLKTYSVADDMDTPIVDKPLFVTWTQSDYLKSHGFDLFSYNVTASNAIPLNRAIPDTRPPGCVHLRAYGDVNLPKATVIICFHNEALSVLLRTVHSVLDRTPPLLLEKIILVDDFSSHGDLFSQLEVEITSLGKVFITRTSRREGLVGARLLGANLATSEVIVFLDAHCECNVGWLEPLLFSLSQDHHKVVSPYIDTIRSESFQYKQSPARLRGGFTWRLEFGWRAAPGSNGLQQETMPILTPVISGGLFAVRREYFAALGSYDPQLYIWGGENFELSFKTWMCGGSVEIVPCSRVGHVFRSSLPYTFTEGRETTVLRNLARVASVWMDDFADIFYAAVNFPDELDIGDTSDRLKLRKRLICQPFKWYLDNIFPEMDIVSPDTTAYGQVRNKGSLMCLDVINSTSGYHLGLSACNGGRNQILRLTSDSQLMQGTACIEPGENKQLSLSLCSEHIRWRYEEDQLILLNTSLCMTSVDNEIVHLLPCQNNNTAGGQLAKTAKPNSPANNLKDNKDFIRDTSWPGGSFQQWSFDYSFNWKRRRREGVV